jgi:hypothetical protein
MWAPVWTGAEHVAFTENPSLDRPVRREALYRLSYPIPKLLDDEMSKIQTFILSVGDCGDTFLDEIDPS